MVEVLSQRHARKSQANRIQQNIQEPCSEDEEDATQDRRWIHALQSMKSMYHKLVDGAEVK